MATKGEAIELDVGDQVVRVSNPSKVYFPQVGITKLELVQHYLACGEGILRALRERPTTLERWPGGVFEGAVIATRADNRGDAFYQKRVPANAPAYVQTAHITFPSGRTADEIAPTSLAVVAWAANLGTITFHPWPVRRGDVDHPDELRLDLDPQPGTDFADSVVVAAELRALLAELGWTGWPKTSGGRGVHIYVRIEPRWDFTAVRHAAIAIGRELERRMPGRVTTKWWKEERGETVFLDYNQNARDRTIASAYSVRPRPQATVSMPLTWDELPGVTPLDFTIRTAGARFAQVGDRHAGIDEVAYDLTPVLEWYERDERDGGLGDMPYPPEYPKMPGEPKRVQPSRDTLRGKDQPGSSVEDPAPGKG
jgi:DNA ligase D-like protein (predicted polymerase)